MSAFQHLSRHAPRPVSAPCRCVADYVVNRSIKNIITNTRRQAELGYLPQVGGHAKAATMAAVPISPSATPP